MATREDWLQAFEAVNGRKPTPQEFQAAKVADFDTMGLLPEAAQGDQAPAETSAASTEAPASEAAAAPTENSAAPEAVQAHPAPQADPVNPRQAAPGTSEAAAAAGVAPTAQAAADGQQKANIIPAIIILVLSVLFFILSLVIAAPLAWLFVVLALATMGAGIFFFIRDLKKSGKLLSIIAFGVSIFFFLASTGTVLVKQVSPSAAGSSSEETVASSASSDDSAKDSTDIDDYVDENSNNFEWKEKDFRNLKFSNKYAGTRLTEIIKKYGKASRGTMSSNGISIRYESDGENGTGDGKSIQLTFAKDDDGHYVLTNGTATNMTDLPVSPVGSRGDTSEWTKSDYDALKESSSDSDTDGSKLSDVTKSHDKPTYATVSLANDGNGFTERLRLSYVSSSSSDSNKLNSVSFYFNKVDDTYYLTDKYGGDDD